MNILGNIRKSKTAKSLVCLAYSVFLFQPLFNSGLFAGNGPLQPEFQGPAVDENQQLVDPFTGDFSYAIDILSEAGIPMNLNYSAGVSMEQEATWVGLGWNLNPGSIVRNLRGFPDDFSGDIIKEETNIRPNTTVGVNVAIGFHELIGLKDSALIAAAEEGLEIVNATAGGKSEKDGESGPGGDIIGGDFAKIGTSLVYNNYDGFSVSTFLNANKSINDNINLGLSINSGNSTSFGGVGIAPSLSFREMDQPENTIQQLKRVNIGAQFTTNTGLKSFNAGSYYNIKSGKSTVSKLVSGRHYGSFEYLGLQHAYTPSVSKEFTNQSYNFSGSFGMEALFADVSSQFDGYFTQTALKEHHTTSPAYGYMYLKNDENNQILQDINREGDIPVSTSATALPIGYYTYDVFNVSAPGIGGSFRAFRNDVGYLQDEKKSNLSVNGDLGVEVAAGATFKAGVDITGVVGKSVSEPFTSNNQLSNGNSHNTVTNTLNSAQTNFQFRYIGENVQNNDIDYTENYGSNTAVEADLRNNFFLPTIKSHKLFYNDASYNPGPLGIGAEPSSFSFDDAANKRTNRVDAAKSIAYYTFDDMTTYYGGNAKYETSVNAQGHHIARIVITAEDGTKYIFGLPVYNNIQEEYSFNVGGDNEPETTSDKYLVEYNSTQKSIGNRNGKDHYYKKSEMPAYAYTYLLTEILAPDYVDMTNNGPSDDDLGNYVLYTYGVKDDITGKYEPNLPNYKWRTPNTENPYYAAYNEGMKHTYHDDKATILYGEKEVWYLSRAETKTHVANFILEDRKDGYTAIDVNGDIGTTGSPCLKALDKIEIYSKFDEIRFNAIDDAPTGEPYDVLSDVPLIPVKIIEFEYDYSLCDNAITNPDGDGKLTLNSVYFTYYESFKSKYSAYSFEYNNNPITIPGYGIWTPQYNPQFQDRWGNVQVNAITLPNREFSYTRQDSRETSDALAGLWNISKINMPDGGYIEIDYEADDYAFVQHKKAARMFQVDGSFSGFDGDFSGVIDDVVGDVIGETKSLYSEDNNLYLYFTLPEEITATDITLANEIFRKDYLYDYDLNTDIGKNLYFKFYVNTDDDDECEDGDDQEVLKYEFIEGYGSVDYESSGVAKLNATDDDYTIGYIKLNAAKYAKLADFEGFLGLSAENCEISSAEISPVTKATWMYTMLNSRENVTGACELETIDDGLEATTFILELIARLSLLETLGTMFMNPNEEMKSLGIGSKFDPNKSFIRLHEPDGVKIGGGYRVAEIRYGDNWNEMTGEQERESIYGTKYIYKKTLNKQTISSGVSAYEPMSGGEENPYRQPSTYTHISDSYKYEYYINQPYGEIFFPSPVVGYSYVEEIPFGIFPDDNPATTDPVSQEVGKTMYWFNTAYDYPTKVSKTELFPIHNKLDPGGIIAFFADISAELYAASQGFAIETNDMHGKPKKVAVTNADGSEIISSSEYTYFESTPGALSNVVPILGKTGRVNDKELGVEYDVFFDFRKNKTWNLGGGVQLGVDATGIALLSGYPKIIANNETTALSVVTKHIQRSGIVKSITKNTNGSVVTATNEVFDGTTGSALIVSEMNEFNDKYYVVNIPAHFVYQELGQASDNWGYAFKHDATHDIIVPETAKLKTVLADDLIPGDKVFLTIKYGGGAVTYKMAWVYEAISGAGVKTEYFIDEFGAPITFGTPVSIAGKVVESGKKNMASNPVMNVICKENPVITIDDQKELQISEASNIIDASVTEFSDIWRIFCTDDILPETICTCNTYPTAGAVALFDLIKILIQTGNLYTYGEEVTIYSNSPTPTYYYGCSPELIEALGLDYGSLLNLTFSGAVGPLPLEDLLCTFKATIGPLASPTVSECEFTMVYNTQLPNLNYAYTGGATTEIEYSYKITGLDDPTTCDELNDFIIDVNFEEYTTKAYFDGSLECENFACFPLRDCYNQSTNPVFCMGGIGDGANPYRVGIRGNWQPKIAYKYLTQRTPEATAMGATDGELEYAIRDQGYYTSFTPFWEPDLFGSWNKTNDDAWTWSAQTMAIDPLAHTASVKDALNIYSSSTYNLNHVAAELVANNAEYHQIAFENYEDDVFLDGYQQTECSAKHFDITPDENGVITQQHAHSGNFSMRLAPDGYAEYSHVLTDVVENRTAFDNDGFVIQSNDCMPDFAPGLDEVNKHYILSLWYRDPFPKHSGAFSSALDIKISLDGTTLIPGELTIGEEIDGWRRVEVEFIMPTSISGAATNLFKVRIENTSPGEANFLFIDDVRIIPVESQAACYVYDFITQRLVAELDDNHYTTFYEYDKEGNLIRVKKETERGVYTIQEARYNSKKSN